MLIWQENYKERRPGSPPRPFVPRLPSQRHGDDTPKAGLRFIRDRLLPAPPPAQTSLPPFHARSVPRSADAPSLCSRVRFPACSVPRWAPARSRRVRSRARSIAPPSPPPRHGFTLCSPEKSPMRSLCLPPLPARPAPPAPSSSTAPSARTRGGAGGGRCAAPAPPGPLPLRRSSPSGSLACEAACDRQGKGERRKDLRAGKQGICGIFLRASSFLFVLCGA
ncbi:hypothetical protein GQ55_4G293000 [Panicum hallii var. hallii]|uniref:Uncharacterized protein n=1 Tax=Panicum hallii var. hallii TaxID=1504633 RepID=A0A2T7E1F8_9POAL|nr:hypothetical protein GQ55_4G293000 [Panicum hallii var. hallii]